MVTGQRKLAPPFCWASNATVSLQQTSHSLLLQEFPINSWNSQWKWKNTKPTLLMKEF